MSDLIKRNSALKGYDTVLSILGNAINAVSEAKAIVLQYGSEPEQRWIPVSEKLPKNKTMVLVTCADGFHRWVDDDEFIDGKFWYCGENVVAWCEYPDPWEGEEDG